MTHPGYVTLDCLAVGGKEVVGCEGVQVPTSSSSAISGVDHEVTHPGRFQGDCDETYLPEMPEQVKRGSDR